MDELAAIAVFADVLDGVPLADAVEEHFDSTWMFLSVCAEDDDLTDLLREAVEEFGAL